MTERSMTISELISLLQDELAKNGDAKVLFTWESIFRWVTPCVIYRSKAIYDVEENTLLLDADGGAYKEAFGKTPK